MNELYDLSYVGCPFTCSNKHSDHTFMKERVDRYLANNEWISMFKKVMVEGVTVSSSNHKLVVLSVIKDIREKIMR